MGKRIIYPGQSNHPQYSYDALIGDIVAPPNSIRESLNTLGHLTTLMSAGLARVEPVYNRLDYSDDVLAHLFSRASRLEERFLRDRQVDGATPPALDEAELLPLSEIGDDRLPLDTFYKVAGLVCRTDTPLANIAANHLC